MYSMLFPKLHLINFSFSIKQATVISTLIVVLTGSSVCLETSVRVFDRASPSENGLCKVTNSLMQPLWNLYLLCPQESDLTFRLASGLVIWQPMWEHRQPEVSGFTALVKPIRSIITGS